MENPGIIINGTCLLFREDKDFSSGNKRLVTSVVWMN